MYDEEYIKRITYGTPENIRIRQFYNQLNNRPLNYGMEDLFPNVNSYTAEPMSAVNNVTWSEPQENNYISTLKDLATTASGRPNIDWARLGNCFYDEFDNSGKLMQLGAENYLNAISYGGYQWANGLIGGNYAERKQNYYNSMPNENWCNAAQFIDNGLAAAAKATFPYEKTAQTVKRGVNHIVPYLKNILHHN